ncbi:N-acetylmuramoyl-L-alanine amidase [Streptomyces sp. NPDC089919]|uniref:N-acetylmuramoyl-L-alanine amidase n=1 Tax=Streptomyces sp. NPDC089919 TaxID=3155188 RepID=UPI003429B5ED
MRGFLASSIGVATAAALALPLALPHHALAATAAPAAPAAAGAVVPGSTQSLPLVPLSPLIPASARAGRTPGMSARLPGLPTAPAAEVRGLGARDVRTFSLVGVVWDDARTELHGRVQVRTRSAATATWSDWQDVETHNREHAADPGTAEGASGKVRGSTAPLWVGESDGIEVRVQAEPGAPEGPAAGAEGATDRAGVPAEDAGTIQPLPSGMRIELVDPGRTPTYVPAESAAAPGTAPIAPAGPAAPAAHDGKNTGRPGAGIPVPDDGSGTADDEDDKGELPAAPGMSQAATETSAANLGLAPLGATEIKALNKADTTADAVINHDGTVSLAARPYIGPRPRIVTRKGWGADESLRERGFVYTNTVKAAFIHHSASGNNYRCSDAPAVLRSLYRYHVVSSGWRDFGYNFAVDKCGTVYEGRAGGVAKPVLGAHTMGFNTNSMGIAVLGTFTDSAPPAAALKAIASLTAWKLGLYGANPLGKTTLTSGGGNLYKKGRLVKMNVISGHRDGFATECPGRKLYGKLPTARQTSARFQGR